MYRLTSSLIIYRQIGKDSILFRLSEIFRIIDRGEYDKTDLIDAIHTEIARLLDIATAYGFDNNLWHCYLAYILATTENPFTLVSEKVGKVDGTVNSLVLNDLSIFKKLFDYDFSAIEDAIGTNCFSTISSYTAVVKGENIYNRSVSEKVLRLSSKIDGADTVEEVYDAITAFYKEYGVGKLGLNKAFRVNVGGAESLLEPVTSIGNMSLDKLVGYERQKNELLRNTRAFLAGRRANNVLLYGDAGTGKSTSVKAILNQFYEDGLRMIEVYKDDFKYLSQIIDEIKNRNYCFIIFMDDLSFEEFETEYKYLKAVIEGGLETKPENVLIYATSNRRHIIREVWDDRTDMSQDDVHRSDTLQEKLSLAARFGLTIGYYKPSREEFYEIVKTLAREYRNFGMPEAELLTLADRWEMRNGGSSGRTAQQFIDYMAGAQ